MFSILSFWFLAFVVGSVLVYYVLPGKMQWVWLLLVSLVFFVLSSGYTMLLHLGYGSMVTFAGARLIDTRCKTPAAKKRVLILTVVLIVAQLVVLKYLDFFVNTGDRLLRFFGVKANIPIFSILAPIGISYYTFSLLGYVVDTYWGATPSEASFFKHTLFACYFPQMTSGPITRYGDMKSELFVPHRFEYENIRNGAQRMLWGYMKKMVIADRIAIFVTTVYADPNTYSGMYIAVAIFLFAAQLYTDFSGCMDIILGTSELFGIKLAENFRTPFFSQSLPEFWRRWHITLGEWSKDYILFPFLKSGFAQKLGKHSKKLLGKKIGKKVPTFLGLAVLWLFVGMWHGGSYKFLVASGLIPGIYLIMSEVWGAFFKNLGHKLHINMETFSFKIFRSVRTFLLLCTSWILVPATTLNTGIETVKSLFNTWNPWVLYDGSLLKLGLDTADFSLLSWGILAVVVVEVLQNRGMQVRDTLAKQNIAFQWIVTFVLIFCVLIFGVYGPGYNATDFIYGGF